MYELAADVLFTLVNGESEIKHIHEIKDEILCRDDGSDLKRGFHRLPRTSFHALEIQLLSIKTWCIEIEVTEFITLLLLTILFGINYFEQSLLTIF